MILVLLGWVSSYFYRVFSGKMTFTEQRKRYLAKYEKVNEIEIKEKFDSLSEDEKNKLLKDIDKNNH